MNTDAAASVLKVSRVRVIQLIASGRLRAVRVEEGWAVADDSVQQFQRMPVGRPRKDGGADMDAKEAERIRREIATLKTAVVMLSERLMRVDGMRKASEFIGSLLRK